MPTGPRIAHIGVAVKSIEDALRFYRDVLGTEPYGWQELDGARVASFPFGDSEVELLEPLVPGSPVAKFLDQRGPGIHHVCYEVDDLEEALERCRALGYQLVDQKPRQGQHGRRIAFLHPKSTSGVLVELTERLRTPSPASASRGG